MSRNAQQSAPAPSLASMFGTMVKAPASKSEPTATDKPARPTVYRVAPSDVLSLLLTMDAAGGRYSAEQVNDARARLAAHDENRLRFSSRCFSGSPRVRRDDGTAVVFSANYRAVYLRALAVIAATK